MLAPARQVLDNAIATNDALGHDNFGSLSYTHGFLPRQQPRIHLPASHAAWDEIANALPELFRTYSVRKAVADLPLLSAHPADLPDIDLARASSLFSILAHVYWYCEPNPPDGGIPPQIQRPWEEITVRLERIKPHLSFIDLNSHNWQFLDPTLEQPFIVENLRLAIPMVGNEDERRFQTAPIEMMYLFSPLMDAILRAQEATLHDDRHALANALVEISDGIKYVTYISLMKVNPNPYNDLYINPVVWGKTAALFASPFQTESIPGPSGTAIPSFTTMDIFFNRKSYTTTVGHETHRTRDWFPKHWRDWLDALEKISVEQYVRTRGDKTLNGIYDEARDAYAGENSLLSRHRLKAYGFLDLSFKAGRMKTLGGVSGSYSERIWDRMAVELDEARLERYSTPSTTHMVPVKRVESLRDHDPQFVRRVVFDIAETGLRYQAGDRCGILPENRPDLIAKTLQALQATGMEMVHLNGQWRAHVNLRHGYQNATELPLGTLLKFGRIRPVSRSVALNLYRLTNNARLLRILDAWAEDQWELWDLLHMLTEAGYNPKRLWKAVPGDYEHICRVVPPEHWRLYSISCVQDARDELHLTVGSFHYQTDDSDISAAGERFGTGSSFLARLANGDSVSGGRVAIKVVHPPRFSLPPDPTRPVVMFAGGTGLAPMRSLIEERLQSENAGPMHLFFGTREAEDFYYRDELAAQVANGRLQVQVAFSRADVQATFNGDTGQFEFTPGQRGYVNALMAQPDNTAMLWNLLQSRRESGQGAYVYICGRTAFATTVLNGLKQIIAQYEPDSALAEARLYRLMGEERLMLEIFTSYPGTHFDETKRQVDISEVVLHNNDAVGYWIIVSGRVYDMNEFNHMHPGGAKIIQSYSGMDGTVAYQKIEHHLNSEVDSMLGMYEIGVLRTPNFGQAWGVAISDKGLRFITLRDAYFAWVDLLFMLVEVENAMLNDFRVRHEPFTHAETHEHVLLSAAKVQQLGQAHERLVTGYLAHVLGEPMHTLWAMTVGLLGQQQLAARWMQNELAAAHALPEAQTVVRLAERLRTQLKAHSDHNPTAVEARFGPFCDALAAEDLRLLHDLKTALRSGLMAFETYGQHTIAVASEQLLSSLQQVPDLLRAFYQRVAGLALE